MRALSWLFASSALPNRSNLKRAPLPETIHATLPPERTRGRRVILIGDVHGCARELEEALSRVGHSPGRDVAICVGDLVNKGPDSLGALRLAMSRQLLAVRGNHEENALWAHARWLAGQPAKELGKLAWVAGLTAEELDFVRSLPLTLSLPERRALVVHGGLVPGVPLERQSPEDLPRMRDVAEGGGVWSRAGATLGRLLKKAVGAESQAVDAARLRGLERSVEGSVAWAAQWVGPPHVFFGHDAKRQLQLENFATGLDTGCVYGRSLTCCVLEPLGVDRSSVADKASARTISILGGAEQAWLVSVPAQTSAVPFAKE